MILRRYRLLIGDAAVEEQYLLSLIPSHSPPVYEGVKHEVQPKERFVQRACCCLGSIIALRASRIDGRRHLLIFSSVAVCQPADDSQRSRDTDSVDRAAFCRHAHGIGKPIQNRKESFSGVSCALIGLCE